MTNYRTEQQSQSPLSAAAQEAKAKRRAVLERVRAQRAHAYKKTVSEWKRLGAIISGSELKAQYQKT
jgi:hypothetical protein